MSSVTRSIREVFRYPSAIGGLLVIASLIGLAIYTLASLPYQKAIELWRGDENTWAETPRNAIPKWLNILTGGHLPETITLSTLDKPDAKVKSAVEGVTMVNATLAFNYRYNAFPSEVTIFYTSPTEGERPFVSAFWVTPDGRKVELEATSINPNQRSYLAVDANLTKLFGDTPVEVGLFQDPKSKEAKVLQGEYKLVLEGFLFDTISDFDAKLVVYGRVYGWAGTDHRRRDLMVALLWGAPLALAFGFLAALGSTLTTFIISAVGVWYGRWVDALIQRITEVNMILPTIPILIMVGTFYSRSIWVILGVVIAHGIFGGGVKTYRSIFLQVKGAPYIEAARIYGASNARLIFRYMVPRIIPVLIPSFVTLIPSYVFLEASLAVLGLGDPVLPTWGKLLQDAGENGALFKGYYYWVVQPAALLMLTGLGFAMVGFALDRIYNPRLRGR